METPKEIEALLKEKRIFKPSEDIVKDSNIKKFMDEHDIESYSELLEKASDYEWWWSENSDIIDWFEPWDRIIDKSKKPFFKWFINGKTNIAYNAVDRHIKTWRKNKVAYIWEGEPGESKKITYYDLYKEVNKFANALKSLGIKKGDRVSIYLPMILELPIAMLACAKIGAIHSVVFSGFSAKALRDRINDAEADVLVTADGFYRRGHIINLKANADEALKDA
ncbi:MAG: acetyl-coenzyme A synthetase, partial [Candidatus Altiarchaeales archaeon]